MTSKIYAHTLKNHSSDEWEPLYGEGGHAPKVQELCGRFYRDMFPNAAADAGMLAEFIGYYHDMGKADPKFQQYLHDSHAGKPAQSCDHKKAAAKWMREHFDKTLADLLSFTLCGHHGGLPKGTELSEIFLDEQYEMPDSVRAALPEGHPMQDYTLKDIKIYLPPKSAHDNMEHLFSLHLWLRMLHSCLIDADWLASESFMDKAQYDKREQKAKASMEELSQRLESKLSAMEATAAKPIDSLRGEIHQACYRAANKAPGVYKLQVPTGGGKTLSSLSFALKHASLHGMKRVIYIIPFTTIIEQTAEQFRKMLGKEVILEHHGQVSEEFGKDAYRFASENWDIPLIVTTNVQFFESLYASQNSRCRKLHNIARSVLIFDEVQSIPMAVLSPCLAMMRSLGRDFGCSIILSTATQPHFSKTEFKMLKGGWEDEEIHSLLEEKFEEKLRQEMRRVKIISLGKQSKEQLLEHFRASGEKSGLIIVNLTKQAQELVKLFRKEFETHPASNASNIKSANSENAAQTSKVQDAPNTENTENADCKIYHLSSRMCPAHRKKTLDELRARLKKSHPSILISTRVIEAGVDISFPVVYRDRCGLDTLAQSAGRCNRHGEQGEQLGITYSYEAQEPEYAIPSLFIDMSDGAESLEKTLEEQCLSKNGEVDYFSDKFMTEYFKNFYRSSLCKSKYYDSYQILAVKIGEDPSLMKSWDFPAIAKEFKLINESQRKVLVPYGEHYNELKARIVNASQSKYSLERQDFRQMQQYQVNIYQSEWTALKDKMEILHEDLGIYALAGAAYDDLCGLLREYKYNK